MSLFLALDALRDIAIDSMRGFSVFEPENSLEALMQAAGKDPGIVPVFYRALLETEMYVLTPEAPMKPGRRRSLKFQEKINIATVEFQGIRWHPASRQKSAYPTT